MYKYLVDSPERRHIDSLSPDGTSTSNTGGVLARSRVDDGLDQDLERIVSGQEVDDLETVLHNSDSQQLLAVVPPVHHQAVHQTLHDGALGLAESLGSVSEMENISKSGKNISLTKVPTCQRSGEETWRTSP